MGALTYHPPVGFEHWLVKFSSQEDTKDAGAIEFFYAIMAREAGVDLPQTRLFETSEGDRFFGIKRFDRQDNHRFHIHTFGNLIGAWCSMFWLITETTM